jgi:O-antigen ligase
MIVLVGLLPLAGLVTLTPGLVVKLGLWLVVAAGGLTASLLATELTKPVTHTLITLYLSVAAVVLAGFVARSPERHMRLIMNAYLWSAFVAAVAGVIGYFHILPGAYELFTKFDRAAGTFKDPNVFGPFLVPALLYAVYLWLNRPIFRAAVPLAMTAFLTFGILLSFSRGAWFNFALSLTAFGGLSFITSRTNLGRIKLFLSSVFGVFGLIAVIMVALQFDEVTKLIDQRASLDQSYDFGSQGRFGGQAKAVGVVVDHPFGIGAREFGAVHHHEDVHNVYLSMLLNAGWIGGFVYLSIVVITLGAGLPLLLRRSPGQDWFIIAWSCFFGVAIEGFVIDTDHWRHFFVLLGLVWGLMVAYHPSRLATEARLTDIGRVRDSLSVRARLAVEAVAQTGRRQNLLLPAPIPLERLSRLTRRLRIARRLRISRRLPTSPAMLH